MTARLDIATLAQLSCLLEVSAPKPGNVSPGMRFRDMSCEDFLVSALAIGPAIAEAGTVPIGVTIERALEATREVTKANTNLGLVLLLTPLAAASILTAGTLRERVQRVLRATTIDDAKLVYNAIRGANPGGMGKVSDQDLGEDPKVTLLKAMDLARERDAVAREYVTDFEITFAHGVPAVRAARRAGLGWLDAVTEAGLTLLSEVPDTLIARKAGGEVALQVSKSARAVLEAGGVRSPAGRQALAEFDASLRDPQNSRNPGTTADLTAAATFVTLLEDGWNPT
ncbi:MAG TPA: triphosphoribosyl-dephospho-CoA synthase [Gemmatimonadales bacterium]|nr:triphosphoribosyl-dephospho-CoA synthase [Gemmatimonadales bacterium]